MAPAWSSKTQTGCLVLICAPFCIAGVVALGMALRTALSPSVNWLNEFGLVAFGLTFAGAGSGFLYAQLKARKKQENLDRLRSLYPQAPWMWREDWSKGHVQSTTRSSMIQAWAMAVVWNLVSSPMVFLVPRWWEAGGGAVLIAIFPVVGVGLLVWAVRETLRWEEFGETWFDLSTLPGAIGGELRGAIHVRFPRIPERGVTLKLSCVNRTVSGSGKSRTVNEKILWRDEQGVPAERLERALTGSRIPVDFKIPTDAVESNSDNPNDSVLWLLEGEAAVPGVDYKDLFEVPVFRTKDTAALGQAEAVPFSPDVEAPVQRPADTRIVVRPSESGGTEFDFSAARNPGPALGTTVFFLLWTGIVGFLLRVKAPIFFPIVFGLFDLLLLVMVVNLWLYTSKVVIGSGRVGVHGGILGLGTTREISFSDIAEFKIPIGMQTGGRTGTPYYDIRLALHNGREVTLASSIRSKLEAQWLIAQMKTLVGLKD